MYSFDHAYYTCVCRNFPMRPNLWKPEYYWLLSVLLYTCSGFLLVCNGDCFHFFSYNGQCCDKMYSVPSNEKKKSVTHPKDSYSFVFIQNPEPSLRLDSAGKDAPPASFSRNWVNFRKTLGCAHGNLDNSGLPQWTFGSWILSSCSPPKEVYLSKFTTRCRGKLRSMLG